MYVVGHRSPGINIVSNGGSFQPGPGPPNPELDSLMYGVEIGYGRKLFDVVTLRGLVGFGNLAFGINEQGPGNTLYVEPGVSAIVPLQFLAPWFVGADANLLILTPNDNTWGSTGAGFSFTAHGQLGVMF